MLTLNHRSKVKITFRTFRTFRTKLQFKIRTEHKISAGNKSITCRVKKPQVK